VEPFPDLSTLSEAEIDEMISELIQEEDAVSYRRRLLHGRIDLLRKEYEVRVKARLDEGVELPELQPKDLERPLFEGTGELPPPHDLGAMPDVATLSDDELRAMIHELEVEEDDVSYHRRTVQGRIDMLRAARAGQLDIESLSRVLSSHPPGPPTGEAA
jgi:hypothetical protein